METLRLRGGGRTTKRKKRNFDMQYVIQNIKEIQDSKAWSDKDYNWRDPHGFWAAVAKELGWGSQEKYRKQLMQMWSRNKDLVNRPTGDIPEEEEEYEEEGENEELGDGEIEEEEDGEIEEEEDGEDENGKDDETKSEKPRAENIDVKRSERKRRLLRKRSFIYEEDIKKEKIVYCICKQVYNPLTGANMICCDSCNEWFHYSCIGVSTKMAKLSDASTIFKCGYNGCNNGHRYYHVNSVLLQDGPLTDYEKIRFEKKDFFVIERIGTLIHLNFYMNKYKNTISINPEKEELQTQTYSDNLLKQLNKIKHIIDEVIQVAHSVSTDTSPNYRYLGERLLQLQIAIDGVKSSYVSDNVAFLKKHCKKVTLFVQQLHDVVDILIGMKSTDTSFPKGEEAFIKLDSAGDGANIPKQKKRIEEQTSDSNDLPVVSDSQNIQMPSVILPIIADDDDNQSYDHADHDYDLGDDISNYECEIVKSTNKVNQIYSPDNDRDETIELVMSDDDHDYFGFQPVLDHDETMPDRNVNSPVIDNTTLGDILDCKIPDSSILQTNLEKTAQFYVDIPLWQKLVHEMKSVNIELKKNNKNPTRHLPKGQWQKLIGKGITESNPYCVFMYQCHKVSIADKRKRRAAPLFVAYGKCKFTTCGVKIHLRMNQVPVMDVIYTGIINHPLSEQRARPIRQGERREIMEIFSCGKKPMKLKAEIMEKKGNKSLVFGNMNDVGLSKSVLANISGESHQLGRLSKDVNESLLKLKAKFQNDIKSPGPVQGLIQNIGLDPMYIYYWLHNRLLLWNKLAKSSVAFIDATGNVGRKTNSGTNVLYYELSLQHTHKGQPTIPIAGALLEKQHQPQISDFLNNFRYNEKILKGRLGVCQPLQINSDWGMAIILSVLDVFNFETMPMYLNRTWKIVTGGGTPLDFKKTVIHICISHHMKIMKKRCLDTGSKNFRFKMYFCSLLVNSQTLQEVQQLLLDGVIIFLSKSMNQTVKEHSERLTMKMNQFDTTLFPIENDLSLEGNNQYMAANDTTQKTGYFTEEDETLRSKSSPYKRWADNIVEEVRDRISNNSSESNSRHCPSFIQVILDLYMPTLPLWSNIMLGDLKRHSSKYADFNIPIHSRAEDTTGNNVAEQRFTVLKHIFLGGRKQLRYDDFSYELEKVFTSCQRSAALSFLKTRTVTPRKPKKSQTLVVEGWSKPEKSIPNSHGKFQQPPTQSIPIVPKSKNVRNDFRNISINGSGMKNLGNTCWFNSVIQAINPTNLAQAFIRNSHQIRDQQMRNIIRIFEHLHINDGTKVPDQLIISIFDDKKTPSTSMFGYQQQDASEFLTTYLSRQIIQENTCYMEVKHIVTCINCSYSSSNIQRDFCTFVSIPQRQKGPFFIADLLREQNEETISDGMTCNRCGTANKTLISSQFNRLPETVILILKRYCQGVNGFIKNDIAIVPDESIVLNDQEFELKSFVCHHGVMGNGGHYTAHVIKSVQDSKYVMTHDDERVEITELQADWPLYHKKNCYILFYNKIYKRSKASIPLSNTSPYPKVKLIADNLFKESECTLPKNIPSMISFLSNCKAMDTIRGVAGPISEFVKAIVLSQYSTITSMLQKTIDYKMDPVSVFRCFLQRLAASSVESNFSTEFFVYVMCDQCERGERKILSTTVYEEEIQNLDQASIIDCFKKKATVMIHQSHSGKCDKCGKNNMLVVETFEILPKSFVFLMKCKNDFPTSMEIDLSLLVNKVYPNRNETFHLRSLMLLQNNVCSTYSISGKGHWVSDGKTVRRQDLLSLWQKSDVCFLRLDKLKTQQMPFDVIEKSYCTTASLSKSLTYKDNISIESFTNKYYSGRCISRCMLDVIISNAWLDSEIIDSYMSLLARKVSKINKMNILHIDPGWLMQKQFDNFDPGQPKADLQFSLKDRWFYNQYILIPANVNGNHWVLVVVDIVEMVVYWCNSDGIVYENIILQIFTYLHQQHFKCFAKPIDITKWSLKYYHEQSGFQLQNDNFSCGTYICMMAKAIVLRQIFSFHPINARYTIAKELRDNIILT